MRPVFNDLLYKSAANHAAKKGAAKKDSATAKGGKKKIREEANDTATLKLRLRDAVEKEDYLLAAKLRDKIKELENEKKDNKVVHGKK